MSSWCGSSEGLFPFPYMFADWIPLLNSTHTRSAHLGFAMFLAFVAFPALKRSPRKSVPIQDWIFALTATCSALYIAVFSNELADRPGLPILQDLVLSGIGLVFLLEATRRSLGLPMMCIALLSRKMTIGKLLVAIVWSS